MAVSSEDRQKVYDLSIVALEDLAKRLEDFHRDWPEFITTNADGRTLHIGLVDSNFQDSLWFSQLTYNKGQQIRPVSLCNEGDHCSAQIESVLSRLADRVP